MKRSTLTAALFTAALCVASTAQADVVTLQAGASGSAPHTKCPH